MSASATTPPTPPTTTVAAGLGGGGGFRSPEEYLAHLRSLGETRFPYADQEVGGAHLDGAALQLGRALAHFLDTFRAVHPGGWRAGVDEVHGLVTNAPRGVAPDELDRQVRRHRSITKQHDRSDARTPRLGPIDRCGAFRAF